MLLSKDWKPGSSTLGTFALNISMKAPRSGAFTEMDAIALIILSPKY